MILFCQSNTLYFYEMNRIEALLLKKKKNVSHKYHTKDVRTRLNEIYENGG
jgi:hypothetical protein